MSHRNVEGLKQVFPGAPIEWIRRLVTSDDETDHLTDGGSGVIHLHDEGAAITLITVEKTQAQSANGDNPPAIEVITTSNSDGGIIIRNEDSSRKFSLRNNTISFVPKYGVASPFNSLGIQAREVGDTTDGGDFYVNAGTAQAAGQTGGTLHLFAGLGGLLSGKVTIGGFNTSVVEIGASSIPTDIKGELTIGGIKFLVVTADPNGSVTAPKGSIATDTTNATLHQNTDGGTTWVAR